MDSSGSVPTSFFALGSMVRYEWQIGRRSASWRLFVVLSLLYGIGIGHVDGHGAGITAYATGDAGLQVLSLVSIFWMSMLGVRETLLRTRTLLLVKPQPAERFALARFVGGLLQVFSFLVALFVGSALMRLFSGTPIGLLGAYIPQFVRAAMSIVFVSCASFTLALLSDSIIAGMLVCLYVVMTVAGKSWLSKFYDPAPIQNGSTYVAVGIVILCIALSLFARRRRGAAPISPWLAPLALGSLLLAFTGFYTIVSEGHDPHTHSSPPLELMGSQDTYLGVQAAGFLLPDENGQQLSSGTFDGNIKVFALWTPSDTDSGLLLQHLDTLQRKYSSKKVQVVAVCLSTDHSAGPTIAKGEGLSYPVVTDWGTTAVPEKLAMSPIASAYRTTTLPFVVVTNRRGRVVDTERGSSCYDIRFLDAAVAHQVELEPH